MNGTDLDVGPLLEPVDRAQVRDYLDGLDDGDGGPTPIALASTRTAAQVAVALAIVAAILLAVAWVAVEDALGGRDGAVPWALGSSAIVLALAAAAVWFGVRAARGWFGTGARWLRLDRFARANGMRFVPRPGVRRLPGMIFTAGLDGEAFDLVRAPKSAAAGPVAARFAEAANLKYTTDVGRFSTTVHWGYVAIRLGTRLPHLVLDATGNDPWFGSSLPRRFPSEHRLRLGAEFDRRFTLYCPPEYEAEALRLFTPDVMERFIDRVAALDVEIVDDWLFLYVRGDLVRPDPETWRWIGSVVDVLVERVGRWERWRDDRLAGERTMQPAPSVAAGAELLRPPPGVSARGRRLRSRLPWALVALGALAVVVEIVSFLADLLGAVR